MPLFLATVEKKPRRPSAAQRLELKGNALVVDLKVFPDQDWRFFAKDDSGNYLKEILAVSHDASAEGPALIRRALLLRATHAVGNLSAN
jgi:hypothetical protein